MPSGKGAEKGVLDNMFSRKGKSLLIVRKKLVTVFERAIEAIAPKTSTDDGCSKAKSSTKFDLDLNWIAPERLSGAIQLRGKRNKAFFEKFFEKRREIQKSEIAISIIMLCEEEIEFDEYEALLWEELTLEPLQSICPVTVCALVCPDFLSSSEMSEERVAPGSHALGGSNERSGRRVLTYSVHPSILVERVGYRIPKIFRYLPSKNTIELVIGGMVALGFAWTAVQWVLASPRIWLCFVLAVVLIFVGGFWYRERLRLAEDIRKEVERGLAVAFSFGRETSKAKRRIRFSEAVGFEKLGERIWFAGKCFNILPYGRKLSLSEESQQRDLGLMVTIWLLRTVDFFPWQINRHPKKSPKKIFDGQSHFSVKRLDNNELHNAINNYCIDDGWDFCCISSEPTQRIGNLAPVRNTFYLVACIDSKDREREYFEEWEERLREVSRKVEQHFQEAPLMFVACSSFSNMIVYGAWFDSLKDALGRVSTQEVLVIAYENVRLANSDCCEYRDSSIIVISCCQEFSVAYYSSDIKAATVNNGLTDLTIEDSGMEYDGKVLRKELI